MSTLRFVVLGLLRDGCARHGYALNKRYRERTGLRMTGGSVYRVLHNLRRDGLVQSIPVPSGDDPRRAPHRITPRGARAFDTWLVAGTDLSYPEVGQTIATRAVFLADVPPAGTSHILEQWCALLRARKAALEHDEVPVGEEDEQGLLPLLCAWRARLLDTEIEFLEALRRHSPAASPPVDARTATSCR
jgi:DNA-binding PadR family transcriptional regulator